MRILNSEVNETMSWLNNSLNTIKGQLSTLAQEVLAETAGPGDDEYRAPLDNDQRSLLQQLTDTQAERDKLLSICESLKLEVNLRLQKYVGAKILLTPIKSIFLY